MADAADMLRQATTPEVAEGLPGTKHDYGRLRRSVVASTMAVSLAPLILMTAVNYYQYDQASRSEAKQSIRRLTSNIKRSLEFFIEERLSALTYIIHDESFEQLRTDAELARILENMKRSLPIGTLVDLGLIDAKGNQVSYVGPYELHAKNYEGQEWFYEVQRRGVYVSDVFLGYRESPHFVLAIWHEAEKGQAYVLRATIDTEMLNEQIMTFGLSPTSDCFLVNRRGILQTPSRRYGDVLNPCPLAVPPRTPETEVADWRDEAGHSVILGYASIEKSPFILMLVSRPGDVMGKWFDLRGKLVLFLIVSVLLIVAVILWGSSKFVNRLRDADEKRTTLLHKVEYTNKLASLGRLAAGTAHEINNPLAIISEKAGLLKDLFTFAGDKPPPVEKMTKLTDSIQQAVDRCSAITHRLLGFAKHMDVQNETLDLHGLIQEVLGFHGKEAAHRNIQVDIKVRNDVPTIRSDRGQLQQVFLNLINNAFAAVQDGGRVEIALERVGPDAVAVAVTDNGVGIPRENLGKVFEPFFTTKKGYGTGLGLSVTYGIVQKLGGQISVESELGRKTCFTVTLPISRNT
jgi:two-component system NtrC family sensor kinase